MALASPADLAAYLHRDEAELNVAAAELALAGASGAVQDWCRWDIAYEERTFTVDGSGHRFLLLPTLHLVSVQEVRLDGEALDADDYTWSVSGQLDRAAGWPRRFRCVEVDCHQGYEPVPDLVRLITLERAARQYENPQRLSAKSVGGVSHSYDLTELEMTQLESYRLP